ncbi:hypothetical protein E2C01_072264 [Portunus trituberculatus]|uniref:Secreted protein n=1 Tax=Portunus trituberculatus TaxID=210409 RepID=A0A5B7I8G4_PORTR|nr:hypothetical protein [Portunus trituberculatus]
MGWACQFAKLVNFVGLCRLLACWVQVSVMSGLEDRTVLPLEVSCHGNSRRSATGSSRDSVKSMDSSDGSQARLERVHDSRMRCRQDVNKL